MKKVCTLVFIIIFLQKISAQIATQDVVLRIPISDEIMMQGDTTVIVQINLSLFTNIEIPEKTLGILQHSFVNDKLDDTTILATGRCYLIKENQFYFGMRYEKKGVPKAGDLLSFRAKVPVCYKGLLYDMSRQSIKFTNIDEKEFYNWEAPFLLKEEKEQQKYFNMMVSDIQYVGKAMKNQNLQANKTIEAGLFKQQKLFDVMIKVTVNELQEFFKYMKARPRKYAGQSWKISEIFATWVDAGAPQAISQ